MAKHPILISFDDLLKDMGQATRRVHDLSISDKRVSDDWALIEDQMLAAISILSGIRNQASETLDNRKLLRRLLRRTAGSKGTTK